MSLTNQQTHRNIAVAQTYTPPKLDGILQSSGYSIPSASTGGVATNDMGGVRARQSRPAHERPSPVAFDGEKGATPIVTPFYFSRCYRNTGSTA